MIIIMVVNSKKDGGNRNNSCSKILITSNQINRCKMMNKRQGLAVGIIRIARRMLKSITKIFPIITKISITF